MKGLTLIMAKKRHPNDNSQIKTNISGRRFRVKISNPELYKGQPHEPLLVKLNKTAGETTRSYHHETFGGGHKKRYRIIDFKRNKDNIPATVERLEYDPNRNANIALLLYADGEKIYNSSKKPSNLVIS